MDATSQFPVETLVEYRTAVVMAGLMVSGADKSSAREHRHEIEAISTSSAKAAEHFADNPLIQAIFSGEHGVANPHTVAELRIPLDKLSQLDLEELALQRISHVAGAVAAGLPMEKADEFRRAVLMVCEAVANAGKEHEFLGIGGVRFSDLERGAYAAIDAALYGSKNPMAKTGAHTFGTTTTGPWTKPGETEAGVNLPKHDDPSQLQ